MLYEVITRYEIIILLNYIFRDQYLNEISTKHLIVTYAFSCVGIVDVENLGSLLICSKNLIVITSYSIHYTKLYEKAVQATLDFINGRKRNSKRLQEPQGRDGLR